MSNDPARGRMKSNTPCLPGFLPVINVGQAGEVTGGSVDSRLPLTPSRIKRASVGSLPSAAHGLIRSKVAPSRPMMSNLVMEWVSPVVDGWSIGQLV